MREAARRLLEAGPTRKARHVEGEDSMTAPGAGPRRLRGGARSRAARQAPRSRGGLWRSAEVVTRGGECGHRGPRRSSARHLPALGRQVGGVVALFGTGESNDIPDPGSAAILARGLEPAATWRRLIEAHVRIVLEDRHADAGLPHRRSPTCRPATVTAGAGAPRKQRPLIGSGCHVLECCAEADERRSGHWRTPRSARPVDLLESSGPAGRAAGRADGRGRATDVRPDPGTATSE